MSDVSPIRSRIVGSGVKKASDFLANPHNWRVHPKQQREVLSGVLREVGWVQQVIENVTTGHLVDGHERVWQAMNAGDVEVPYLQVSLTEDEEKLILTVLDPIASLAATDAAKLNELLQDIETGDPAVSQLLDDLAKAAGLVPPDQHGQTPPTDLEYRIIVECKSEREQTELLERFKHEGLKCQPLIS